jgi:triphosphatase
MQHTHGAELLLELIVPPNSLPALRSALEEGDAKPAARRQLVTTTYYDTSDFHLRRHHLGFWLQKRRGRYVQALTDFGRDTGNDIDGGEWRDLIDTNIPDLTAPQTGARLPTTISDGGLKSLFITRARRTALKVITDPAVEVVASLDDGEILATNAASAESDCRLSLELRRGECAAVYDMAIRLLDAVPLRIATQNRLERGYQLCGYEPEVAMAEPLVLDPSMTVEMVLQRVGHECLNHLLRNEPAAAAGNPEAFHQIRVAMRRVRSVLTAMRPMLPPEQYQWLKNELKWLAASLGPARDWDVFATNLLAPVRSALKAESDLENLTEAVTHRQQAALEVARKAIGSRRYAEAMLKMLRWFETCGWREQRVSEHSALLFSSISGVAPALIERRWGQAMKRSKNFPELAQGDRHQVRIALKELRYMIEFLGSLFDPSSMKALTKRLKGLQEDLGHLNDVHTAQELIRELARPPCNTINVVHATGVLIGWYLHELTEIEEDLRKAVRRFRKAKPFWRPLASAAPAPTA